MYIYSSTNDIYLQLHDFQIETATMAELDWALAHMGGTKTKKRPKGKSKEVDWVYEAESKGSKEEVRVSSRARCLPHPHAHVFQTELRGLGALLFDNGNNYIS